MRVISASEKPETLYFNKLSGGKLQFDSEDEFFSYVLEHPHECIVPKLPDSNLHRPLIVDMDIKLKQACDRDDTDMYFTYILEYICILRKYVDKPFIAYALRRAQRKIEKDDKIIYKDGIHILFKNISLTPDLAHKIRSEFLESDSVQSQLEMGLIEDLEDVVDTKITPFKNTCTFLAPNLKKPDMPPYLPIFEIHSEPEKNILARPIPSEEKKTYLKENIKNIYHYIYHSHEYNKYGSQPIAKSKPTASKPEPTTCQRFNLEAFLKAFPSDKIQNLPYDEWLQVVSFCAWIGFPKQECCRLLNEYCKPSKPHENQELYENFCKDAKNVAKHGSIVRLLWKYCENMPDKDTIFPKPAQGSATYNDYTSFVNRELHLSEIEAYFESLITYVAKQHAYCYKITKVITDNKGHQIVQKELILHKYAPFTREDSFYVHVIKSKCKMIKELVKDKHVDKNGSEHKILKKLSHKNVLARYKKFYEHDDDPERQIYNTVLSSKIIENLQKQVRLQRCTMFDFYPYCGDNDNRIDPHVFNKFGGYYLENYEPTEKINIRNTNLFRYFTTVFGWQEGNEKSVRCQEIFNRIAFWLQYPRIRTHYLYCLCSEKQGTGKSFFYQILQAIFGRDLTSFHLDLSTYLSNFNISDSGLLIKLIDDLAGAQKQTRKLFSRITCDEQYYEAKYMDKIKLKEYSEVIVTGNDKSCSFHVTSEDRRILIWNICPDLKPDKKFWRDLGNEVENLDVMHAWYTFFKNRDLSDYDYKEVPKELDATKIDAVMNQRPKSHEFLDMYFSSLNFMEDYAPHQCTTWKTNMMVSKMRLGCKPKERYGQILIRYEQKQLYAAYQQFVKQLYPNSKSRDFKTFIAEIEQLGAIVKQRVRVKPKGKIRNVFDFYQPDFESLHMERYKKKPNTWFVEDTKEFERVSTTLAKHCSKSDAYQFV